MIKAVVRDGVIHPLDPLPGHWVEGQQVVVDDWEETPSPEALDAWNARLEELASQFDADDFTTMDRILAEADEQAKAVVRVQMGLGG